MAMALHSCPTRAPRLAVRVQAQAGPRPRTASRRPLPVPPQVKPGPVENYNAPLWLDAPLKHVIESQQFNQEALAKIFEVARQMEGVRPGTPESKALEGAVMSTLFYEPSTRTRLSFEAAMSKLGGTVLSTESAGQFSSAAKGETLEGGSATRMDWCCFGYIAVRHLRHALPRRR
jgi:Aspartate/ornithine carbamoyltransferase, carbamoyl-P binding domain